MTEQMPAGQPIVDVTIHVSGDAPWSTYRGVGVVLVSPRRADSDGVQTGIQIDAWDLDALDALIEVAQAARLNLMPPGVEGTD